MGFPDLVAYVLKGISIQRVIWNDRKRDYHNSVAVCARCSSQMNTHGDNIEGVYLARLDGSIKDKASKYTGRITYPDNINLFNQAISERGLDPTMFIPNPHIVYLDPSKIPEVALRARRDPSRIVNPRRMIKSKSGSLA